ncbi:hypothetical protein GMSM_22080 [Geomonas sp. Red276]
MTSRLVLFYPRPFTLAPNLPLTLTLSPMGAREYEKGLRVAEGRVEEVVTFSVEALP